MAEMSIEVTDQGGVKLTMHHGPVLASMIFDHSDGERVLTGLTEAFAAAAKAQGEPHPHPHPEPPAPEKPKRTKRKST
jgi:hypothetical protein